MSQQNPSDFERRIAELEARVAELESLRRPVSEVRTQRPVAAPRSADALDRFLARAAQPQNWVESSEGWLGRVGVALMALGFVFLYRYAVDQGWLTPALRIATGLAVGSALVVAGHVRFAGRERYRQIVIGGGVVILFITGLAASELYHLVPGGIALIFHAAVAAVAFTIAARQKDAVMASIGSAGAFVPPAFLLEDAVPGAALWLYLAIMIGWTGALYAKRGWKSFFAMSAIFAIAALMTNTGPGTWDKAPALIAMIVAWVTYSALPLVHADRSAATRTTGAPIDPMIFLLPLVATVGIAVAADLHITAPRVFAITCAMGAVALAILTTSLKQTTGSDATSDTEPAITSDPFAAAVVSVTALLAIAAVTGIDAPDWNVAIAAIGALAIFASRRLRVGELVPIVHALFVVVALQVLGRIDAISAAPAFDREAITLAIATAAGAWTAFQVRRQERMIYLAGVFIAAHTLLATELSDVPGAAWLGSASWFVIGSALVLQGLSRGNLVLQRAGMISLALLVARLFMFDLANAGTGVRIVLFLVCGVAFLALSYRFRARQHAA